MWIARSLSTFFGSPTHLFRLDHERFNFYVGQIFFFNNHNLLMQKLVTLKRVTCKSFPWNKAADFRTPILCPNMDKNEIVNACVGKCVSYITSK